jgi:molybdenum cofactor cytidylyltransferase
MILSAGESSRMGTPKALLEYDGSTFIQRLLRLFSEAADDTVIVLGHQADLISRTLPMAWTLENRAYHRGMLTSLQCGIKAAPSDTDRFIFTLVDLPAVAASTVMAVAGAGGEVVIPRYQGRRGHPVAFSASVAREILSLPETASAKDVLQKDASRVVHLEVDDAEIVNDIDTPGDYRDLLQRKSAAVL